MVKAILRASIARVMARKSGQILVELRKKFKNMVHNLYQKIANTIKSHTDEVTAHSDKVFHKKDGYKSCGLKIPTLKKIINDYKKEIKDLDLKSRFTLAGLLYRSGYAEEGRVGNAVLALSVSELKPEHYNKLNDFLDLFNNWDEVDDYSINITQPLLNKYPTETLSLLTDWNQSENMWKRRASVVAFVRKVGESGKYTSEVIKLCDNLIWDKEDLVQKAVGWALKDNIRGARTDVIDYIKKLRRKKVSATITLYAIRDLKGAEKQEIINIK